jgi:hypothetical protein
MVDGRIRFLPFVMAVAVGGKRVTTTLARPKQKDMGRTRGYYCKITKMGLI